jgi:hypothetical protein
MPWLSSLDNFKYYAALKSSRAYELTLSDWEGVMDVKFEDTPESFQHRMLLKQVDPNLKLDCLIPFLDMCNHRAMKDGQEDSTFFSIYWSKGTVYAGLRDDFKPGQEYDYHYRAKASNQDLVFTYGFSLPGNPYSRVFIYFNLMRGQMSLRKYLICKELKCTYDDLEGFYNTAFDKVSVRMPILASGPIDKDFLNLLRLYAYDIIDFNLDKPMLLKRLSKGQWISYENEIRAVFLYKNFIQQYLGSLKLNLVMSLFYF